MKFAILETIATSGGHELEFDRMVIEELKQLGHEVIMYVPYGYEVRYDKVEYRRLDAKIISYVGLSGIKKLFAGLKREYYRQKCFSEMYKRALQGEFDAIIVPTAGYRFLRAVRFNKLKKAPVPVLFGFNGITPKEFPKFLKQVEKLKNYSKMRCTVQTCTQNIFAYQFQNKQIYCILPPVYTPRDLGLKENCYDKEKTLLIGTFGQFRREKNLDKFLEIFLQGNYQKKVKLLVQGATVSPADSEEFERIRQKFKNCQELQFVHKGLWGKEWQEAINSIDVLFLPYGSLRYKYSWSGMLFTAMGYLKPVIASAKVLPEDFGQYEIGVFFEEGQMETTLKAIECFVNSYDEKHTVYKKELQRAAQDYSASLYAEKLVSIALKEDN